MKKRVSSPTRMAVREMSTNANPSESCGEPEALHRLRMPSSVRCLAGAYRSAAPVVANVCALSSSTTWSAIWPRRRDRPEPGRDHGDAGGKRRAPRPWSPGRGYRTARSCRSSRARHDRGPQQRRGVPVVEGKLDVSAWSSSRHVVTSAMPPAARSTAHRRPSLWPRALRQRSLEFEDVGGEVPMKRFRTDPRRPVLGRVHSSGRDVAAVAIRDSPPPDSQHEVQPRRHQQMSASKHGRVRVSESGRHRRHVGARLYSLPPRPAAAIHSAGMPPFATLLTRLRVHRRGG